MTHADGNPWLRIPVDDYEAHMSAVGQAAVLRDCFAHLYIQRRPRRVALLGCTTGADLREIDPGVTDTVVGVEINPDYLAVARARWRALGPMLTLVHGDVLQVHLEAGGFDLVHAALVIEHVDAAALLERTRAWLAPDGLCSVISQDPHHGVPEVSHSSFASLQALAGRMRLFEADDVAAVAAGVGLRLRRRRTVRLPSGKSLTHSIFDHAPASSV